MKLAVLDLGSNSFHLLVARGTTDGELVKVDSCKEMVRLGAGTLQTGLIDDRAQRRGLEAIGRLVARASAHEPERLVAVATSAIREARNGAAFAADVQRLFGFPVEVLSGDDEAQLVYAAARSAMRPTGRMAVIDVGGGSVEIAVGSGARPVQVHSLPLGVVRLRDRLVPADGYVSELTALAVSGVVRAVAADAARDVRALAPELVVFTSGTAKAVARLAHELGTHPCDPDELGLDALRRLRSILAKFKPSSLAQLGVEPARADTIAVGAVVLETLLEVLGVEEAQISPRALREGVALRELAAEATLLAGVRRRTVRVAASSRA